jgi:hypothetical protein
MKVNVILWKARIYLVLWQLLAVYNSRFSLLVDPIREGQLSKIYNIMIIYTTRAKIKIKL